MFDSPLNSDQNQELEGHVLWQGESHVLLLPTNSEKSNGIVDENNRKTFVEELSRALIGAAELRNTLEQDLNRLDEDHNFSADVKGLVQHVMVLVDQQRLVAAPADTIITAPAAESKPQTISKQQHLHSGKSGASKKKPQKKVLKRQPKTNKSNAPVTPSQLVSNDQLPAIEDVDFYAPKVSANKSATTTAPATANSSDLLTVFNSENPANSAPVSRWVGAIDQPPGLGQVVENSEIVTKAADKVVKKQGKLSYGKACPKNPRLCNPCCPINLISGEELLQQTDFEFPGPIPFLWQRIYRTSHAKDVGLGCGWSSPWFARIDIKENEIIFHDGEGREVPFDRVTGGQSCRNAIEKLQMHCDDASVYRVISQDQLIYTFGGTGKRKQLYEVANREGYAIKLYYSANQRLIHIGDSAGRRLKLEYNITEQVRRIFLCDDNDNPQGDALVEYSYSNDGDLIEATDSGGHKQSFVYRNHVITKRTTKDGYHYHLEFDQYNAKGKCVHAWGEDGSYDYRFKYDEANKITRSTNSLGHTTEFHYNDLGLITTEIDPGGSICHISYDSYGNLIAQRDPVGGNTLFTYDENNNLTSITDALGHITELKYDEQGNLIQIKDAKNQTWQRTYDNKGRMTSSIDANGLKTQYSYNDNGLLTSVADPLGRRETFSWNQRAELIEHTDTSGNAIRYDYDASGRVVKMTDAQGSATLYTYDRSGNITQLIQANGASIQMQYSAAGHLIQHIDPIGRSTRYRYNAIGLPIERHDANGNKIHYEYDKQRNLIALINENNERHELEYDKSNRIIKETGFDGRIQQYMYNAAGQLVRHNDGSHRVTVFKRDALGRLIYKRSNDTEYCQYDYDALGFLIKASNNHSVVHLRYDIYGQLIGELQNGHRIQHRYKLPGLRTHTSLPNEKSIRYDYNQQGLLARLILDKKVVSTIKRNQQGLELQRSAGELHTLFKYDPMGRLLQQATVNNELLILERRYRYDKTGNLRQIEDLKKGHCKYHYDALDRLKAAEGVLQEIFNFDPAGNILDAEDSANSVYVKGNRLGQFNDYRFDYDDVGNLVRERKGDKETFFYYNVQNQLVSVKKDGQSFDYAYDALGRRISKRDAFGETTYLWDANVLLCEHRNNIQILYLHDPKSFLPFCQIRDGEIYYYHNDHIGTPQQLTNSAGDVVWDASYQAYGNIAKYELESIDNALRFQGQYHDHETGLYYSRHRYYHPITGRFISQDSNGLLGGTNLYSYAPNPITWIDPLGTHYRPLERHNPNEVLLRTRANTDLLPPTLHQQELGAHLEPLSVGPADKTIYQNDQLCGSKSATQLVHTICDTLGALLPANILKRIRKN